LSQLELRTYTSPCHTRVTNSVETNWNRGTRIENSKQGKDKNTRRKQRFTLVRPDRFELPTYWFVVKLSP